MVYMFVFENYNLKPDYMYFLPANFNGPDTSFAVIFGIICIIFVLAFIFRASISDAKEKLKKSIRAYIKPFFFRVKGDTLHIDNDGILQFIWEYLDDHFLTPSLPGSQYEHLYDLNYGEDSDSGSGSDEDDEDDEDEDDNENNVKEGMINKLEYSEIGDETDSEDDE